MRVTASPTYWSRAYLKTWCCMPARRASGPPQLGLADQACRSAATAAVVASSFQRMVGRFAGGKNASVTRRRLLKQQGSSLLVKTAAGYIGPEPLMHAASLVCGQGPLTRRSGKRRCRLILRREACHWPADVPYRLRCIHMPMHPLMLLAQCVGQLRLGHAEHKGTVKVGGRPAPISL
jgi:hypothetical protein